MTIRELVTGLVGAGLGLAIAAAGVLGWFDSARPGERAARKDVFVQPTEEEKKTLAIVAIQCHGPADTCALKSDLDVVLKHLPSYWVEATKLRLRDLSLVIGGIDFPHITARPIDGSSTTLKFTLDPSLDAAQWKRLYANQDETAKFSVALAVPVDSPAVGKTPDLRFASNAVIADFDIRPDLATSLIYAFLVLLVVVLVCLAWWSTLLRDAGPKPAQGEKRYSLARTQLALWTLVVVGAYLFLWTVLGTKNPLNQTGLILIGLSALTGLTATAVDTKNAAADAAAGAAPAARPSEGFWRDLLSDEDGIAISRVQMAIWTLVLAFVFAYSVWTDLAMPDYDTVLLGLLGVSNGTYVGLKLK